jgi:hypothetical protein
MSSGESSEAARSLSTRSWRISLTGRSSRRATSSSAVPVRILVGATFAVEPAHGAQNDVEFLDQVDRQTHRARLIHDRAFDILANPPRGVSRKTEAALGIEFFQGVDQAQVALLDQIVERQSAVQVMPRDTHHQAQVGLDHALARMKISGMGAARASLSSSAAVSKRRGTDLVQINLGDVLDETRIMRIRDSLGRVALRQGMRRRSWDGACSGREGNFCGSAGLP